MFRALAFAAALTALPFAPAQAQDPVEDASARLEAATEAFGARMEEFGARAEVIGNDETLSEDEREARIMQIYAEYEPDIAAFSTLASQHAAEIAALAVAEADIEAEVARAVDAAAIEAEVEAALAEARLDQAEWTGGGEDALEAQIAGAVVQAIANMDFTSIIETAMAQADIEAVMAEAMANLDADFETGDEAE